MSFINWLLLSKTYPQLIAFVRIYSHLLNEISEPVATIVTADH